MTELSDCPFCGAELNEATHPGAITDDEVERLREAMSILADIVGNANEAMKFGPFDCIDNTGEPYQSDALFKALERGRKLLARVALSSCRIGGDEVECTILDKTMRLCPRHGHSHSILHSPPAIESITYAYEQGFRWPERFGINREALSLHKGGRDGD